MSRFVFFPSFACRNQVACTRRFLKFCAIDCRGRATNPDLPRRNAKGQGGNRRAANQSQDISSRPGFKLDVNLFLNIEIHLQPLVSPLLLFLIQVSKCEICPNQLDLPSVHFLCGHSFHQHCFDSYADNDQECLTCLPEIRRIQVHLH